MEEAPDRRAVRVLVVDDQPTFRRAAGAVCRQTPRFEVVGDAASGEDGVEMARTLRPDFVLMDINLPTISGIEAARQITSWRPDTVVVLVSTYHLDDVPADARDCGAHGYVHKERLTPTVLQQLWEERDRRRWVAV